MNKNNLLKKDTFRSRILVYGIGLGLCWLIALGGLFLWEVGAYRDSMLKLAVAEARASFNKDLVYRRWVAGHGGVYVPVTAQNPPNPYLSDVAERDITTPSGKPLTLVNPAYMARQVHELADKQYRVKGHITSLNPLRSENGPDNWEREALHAFQTGETEVRSVSLMDGEEYIRLMIPLMVEKSCFKCHGYQGYKEGDIRGGISVSVPMSEFTAITKQNIFILACVHITIFLIGLCGIGFSFSSLERKRRQQDSVERALQESENTWRVLLNAKTEVALLIEVDGTLIAMNELASDHLGRGVDELLGKNVYDYLDEKTVTFRKGMVAEVVEKGQSVQFTDTRDGRLLNHSLWPLYDGAGKVYRIAIFAWDITKEKEAEVALRESEQKFKTMFEQAPLSYQSLDEQGDFVEVNNTWLASLGYSRGEVIGKNFSEFLVPEWRSHFKENFPRFKAIGEILGVEFEMVKKDGSLILVSFHGKISKAQDGSFERTHCVFNDVTIQRMAEETLLTDLELNRAIAGIAQELLSDTYDLKRVSEVVLNAAKKITGSEHGFVSSIDKESLENVGHTLTEMFGDSCNIKDKRIAFPVGEDDSYGRLWGHALNTGKPFFTNEQMVHQSSAGIPDGHIPLENYLEVPVVVADDILGFVALANSCRDYSDHDILSVQRIAELFALALHRQGYEIQRADMEQNLRQLQKNEAIGVLAGGIAHDFNNILTPIIGYTEMLKEDVDPDDSSQESVNEILMAAERAKALVQQILTFSRQHEQEIKPLKPYLLIKEVIKLIKATIPSTIEIKQDIDNNCRTIMADPTQIHQVAMNLLTNAYHSMQEAGGILTISLKNIDGTDVNLDGKIGVGNHIVLTIQDTGVGIDKATIGKIFDPYFTTKSKDKGTGLGLSVVYGIVKNYNGEIVVESKPGQGAKFEVYLPAVDTALVEEDIRVESASLGGDERILLVDDEISILDLEKRMLERLGYRVSKVSDSLRALEIIRSTPGMFDLLITDMTMPKMTGDLLTQEIRKVNTTIPIIICTGFSEIMTPERAVFIGANGLLLKPVPKSELTKMVRNVLDKSSNGNS